MMLFCTLCNTRSPAKYQQNGADVCERCMELNVPVRCFRCNTRRPAEQTAILQSCPCYDSEIEEDNQSEEDDRETSDSDSDQAEDVLYV